MPGLSSNRSVHVDVGIEQDVTRKIDLSLDAKGMDIHSIAIVKNGTTAPLKYNYDGMVLKIHLDKTYKYTEKYTVFIDYTSKPNELKTSD